MRKLAAVAATAAFALIAPWNSGTAEAAIATLTGSDCGIVGGAGTTLPVAGAITCSADPARTDEGDIEFNAPAAGDDFYSLGLYGGLTYSIVPDFISPGSVVEVTFRSNHTESIDVYVSATGLAGDWTKIGNVDNNNGNPANTTHALPVFAGQFSHIGFRDVTKTEFPGTGSTDGFDIAAFSVTPVPIPGAVWLFGSGVLGLLGVGYSRRRKAAA